MKYFNVLLTLLFALIILSCSDDDSNTNPDDNNATLKLGEMKCTIDGAAWSCQNSVAANDGDGAASVSGSRFINSNTGTEGIGMMFENLKTGQNTAVVTFTLLANMNNPTDIQIWGQENVTVQITKLNDEEVEGNFSATLVGLSSEKKITNCKFRAKFLN